MRVECQAEAAGLRYVLYKEAEPIGQALLADGCLAGLEVTACWRGRGYGSYLVKELLRQNGAKQALMTGSGAAVFGVFDDPERAEAARAALAKEYRQVYLAAPDKGGARVLPAPKRRG